MNIYNILLFFQQFLQVIKFHQKFTPWRTVGKHTTVKCGYKSGILPTNYNPASELSVQISFVYLI